MSWKRNIGLLIFVNISFWFFSVSPVHAISYYRTPPVLPENARTAEVSIWKDGFKDRVKWMTFEKNFVQGADLASGDVDGDGKDEMIVGSGPGRSPEVRIYSAVGIKKTQFNVFIPSFKGGVRVAVGDINGDGISEIVVAPGEGFEPLIYLYGGDGKRIKKDGVYAYNKEFKGGVHVVAADINRDDKAEIITSPGPGGGPHVRIFDGDLQNLGFDFFPLDANMRDGLSITALKTPAGTLLAVAPESWSAPNVRLYSFFGRPGYLWDIAAFPIDAKNGLVLSAFDEDGDGYDELVAAPNGGTVPEVRIFDWFGQMRGRYMLHDPNYRGALSFTELDADGDGRMELATVAAVPVVVGPLEKEKFIDVSIKEQRLYAYEHGRLVNNFLISSGTYKYPTPLVETRVKEKIPLKGYKWTYGVDHPDNYDLKNVKNNLRIFGSIYIHYAYWHRNFGHRMSHGCINVGLEDSTWIYNWADVGTDVRTRL